MPIKRAALRSLKKDIKRHERNQAIDSELKTLKRRFLALVGEKNKAEASKLYPQVVKRFDQAAAKNKIHRNVASRTKSRLAKQLAKITS